MTSCPQPPTHVPVQGPISQAQNATDYLRKHNIPSLLNGLLAGLMVCLPSDHIDYMKQNMNVARQLGAENINWQSFVWSRHPHQDPQRRKLIKPPVQIDGGNLPVGVLEKRDFLLTLVDEESVRRPWRLPFWHVDYFTQPQLDHPDFLLEPDWSVPDFRRSTLATAQDCEALIFPDRLCPSPPPPNQDIFAMFGMKPKESDTSSCPTSSTSEEEEEAEDDCQIPSEELLTSAICLRYVNQQASSVDGQMTQLPSASSATATASAAPSANAISASPSVNAT